MEEPVEGRVHHVGRARVRGREGRARIGAAKAEPPGEVGRLGRVVGQPVCLPLVDDLELVLDVAQEAVGLGQLRRLRRRHVAARRETLERGQRPAHAQPRILAGVHELMRLDEELDLPDAAAAELHVARARRGIAQRHVDLALHRLEVGERPEVEVAAVDEGLELGEQRRAERAVARDHPRLEPRGALPRLPPALVVRERGRPRHGNRPLAAPGPEPQVDAEAEPVGGDLGEGAGHLLAHSGGELAHGATSRQLAVARIDVDEVDVGAVIELAAAELAHAEHGEAGILGMPLRQQPRANAPERRLDERLGERRELAHRLVHGGEPDQVAAADAHELAPVVAAERGCKLGAPERAGRPRSGERRGVLGHVPAGDGEHRLEQRGPAFSLGRKHGGEPGAPPEDAQQRGHAARLWRRLGRGEQPHEPVHGAERVGRRREPAGHLGGGGGGEPAGHRRGCGDHRRRVGHARGRKRIGAHGPSRSRR